MSAAENQYRYAAELAQDANHAAEEGKKIYAHYYYQRNRLVEWDRTIAPQRATLLAFIILFPIIAIVEYMFSEELYRDVLPNFPWALGVIFAVLAVIIAELIVYRCFEVKRQWKTNELRRSERWASFPEPIINRQVKKITQRLLYVGVLLFAIMVIILSYMSWDRVNRLVNAGERINSFGPADLLPIILYIFEVFTGMFIWYGILRLFLGLNVVSRKRKFDAAVKRCSELTIDAVQAFNRAEELGYNIFKNPVTNSIREAFCRNDTLSEANGIDYISEQKIGLFPIELHLFHLGTNQAIVGNIRVVTDYKFIESKGTSDGKLNLEMESFLRLRPEQDNRTGDSIRTIYAEFQVNGTVTNKTLNVAIDMDQTGPHPIFL